MLKMRSAVFVLGLAVVGPALTTTHAALAATPAEQAAFREEARKLTEQARGLEAQADAARETAKNIYLAELKKADAQDDQADLRKIPAYQKWLQAGAYKEARGAALRDSARSLFLAAYNFNVRALIADEQEANAKSRAKQQRDAAKALLASNPDAETKAIAAELNRQADEDEKDGRDFAREGKQLRERADRAKKQGDALVARAVQLETAQPKK